MNSEEAFPMIIDGDSVVHLGMSLRDWFSGMAVQGMIASISTNDALEAFQHLCRESDIPVPDLHAEMAYRGADDMLAERQKKIQKSY